MRKVALVEKRKVRNESIKINDAGINLIVRQFICMTKIIEIFNLNLPCLTSNFAVQFRGNPSKILFLHDLEINQLKKKSVICSNGFCSLSRCVPSPGGAPKTTRLLVDLIRHQLRKIAALRPRANYCLLLAIFIFISARRLQNCSSMCFFLYPTVHSIIRPILIYIY
jgi:hypothetical protein